MSKVLIIAAALVPLFFYGVASVSACNTIFKAGKGYIDSCTGDQRSPYADLVYPTKTPTPSPPVEPVVIIVYQTAPTPKKPGYYPQPATPTPTPCFSVNGLGRCPVPGDKWVYNNETGQIYPNTSVVPPYSDQVAP